MKFFKIILTRNHGFIDIGAYLLSTVNTLPQNLLEISDSVPGFVVILPSSIFRVDQQKQHWTPPVNKPKEKPMVARWLREIYLYSVFTVSSNSLIQYFVHRCITQLPAFPQNGFLISHSPYSEDNVGVV